MKRPKFIRCPTVFGPYRDKWGETLAACGYEGRAEKALKPRPSTKPVLICPSCLSEVK